VPIGTLYGVFFNSMLIARHSVEWKEGNARLEHPHSFWAYGGCFQFFPAVGFGWKCLVVGSGIGEGEGRYERSGAGFLMALLMP
jgi:hypothetical protein